MKRFLSTILALTMLCSCTVVMNVSTAFAADSWSVVASDFFDQYTPLQTCSTSSGDRSTASTATVTTSDGSTIAVGSTDTYYYCVAGARASYAGYTYTNNTGKSFSYEMVGAGSRTITVTPTGSGTVTVYWYATSNGNSVTVGTTTESVSGDTRGVVQATSYDTIGSEFTISTSASNMAILGIDFEPGTVVQYTWTLDTTSLSAVNSENVSLGSSITTTTSNKLVYSGSDYEVKDDYVTLTAEIEGVDFNSITNTYTVTPTDNWFEAVVARESITDSAFINASDLTDDLSNGDVFGTYFEFYTTNTGNTATIESPNFGSYGNLSYSNRLKLGGTNRNIKFTITGDALVQIVFASNNNSSSRDCNISKTAAGTAVESLSTPSTNAMNSPTVMTCALEGSAEGTDYYIYTTSGGINIYSINIVVGATFADNTDSADTSIGSYVNGTDSYILATVAETKIEDGTALTIGGNTSETFDSTETVYTYVQVDNFVFAAADVNSDESYIYGGKLTSSPDNAASLIAKYATATVE